MNTSGVENNLTQALTRLSAEWDETRNYWRDAKSLEFEKNTLDPLPRHVARAATAIAELNALLRKVRHDCE